MLAFSSYAYIHESCVLRCCLFYLLDLVDCIVTPLASHVALYVAALNYRRVFNFVHQSLRHTSEKDEVSAAEVQPRYSPKIQGDLY